MYALYTQVHHYLHPLASTHITPPRQTQQHSMRVKPAPNWLQHQAAHLQERLVFDWVNAGRLFLDHPGPIVVQTLLQPAGHRQGTTTPGSLVFSCRLVTSKPGRGTADLLCIAAACQDLMA
jgi:hypothetical protein